MTLAPRMCAPILVLRLLKVEQLNISTPCTVEIIMFAVYSVWLTLSFTQQLMPDPSRKRSPLAGTIGERPSSIILFSIY